MGTTGVTVLPADQFVSSQCMAQINYLGRFSFNEMSYGYIALKKNVENHVNFLQIKHESSD